MGPNKRGLSAALMDKLRIKYGEGGLLHYGQGKWYPGEQLPRWSLNLFWRKDGEPIWTHPELLADEKRDYGATEVEAQQAARRRGEAARPRPEVRVPRLRRPLGITFGASASCRATSTRSMHDWPTRSSATASARSSRRGSTRSSGTGSRLRATHAIRSP